MKPGYTIANLEPGDHLCCLYETEEEHRAVLTPFLRQGLERDEKVLYIGYAHTAEVILGYLWDDGLDVEPYLSRGQLAILTPDDTYMRGGLFDPEAMIELLRAETEQAVAEGYQALRVTGEMTWALRGLPGSERLIEYEARLNEFFPGSKCLAICQYDRRRFDPTVLLDVLRTHPIAVIGAELFDNFYYIPPAELLGSDLPAVNLRHWMQNLAERKRAEEALTKERNLLSTIIDNLPDYIYVKDTESRFVIGNIAVGRLMGATKPDELVGKTDFDFYPQELAAGYYADEQEIMRSGQPLINREEPLMDQMSDRKGWLLTTKVPLRDSDGKIVGLVGIGRDITERKRAEEELRRYHNHLEELVAERTAELAEANEQLQRDITERKRAEEALQKSEERFRNLFKNAPLCIFQVDLSQTPPTIVRANRQAEKVYGWSSEEFASVPIEKVVPAEAIPDVERMVDALRAGETITLESIHKRRDGSVFPVHVSAASKTMTDPNRIILTVEDITVEKDRRSEEEAIAEERRRIAREIHDGLAQSLASLRFKAKLWHDLIDDDPAQMHAELDALRELLSENIREVRRSIFALRPVALDQLGFYPALRQFTSDFGEQNQLHVELRISGPDERLPPHLEPVLFRIVQETLNNVGKHAQASTVWVDLNLEATDAVTLRVRDDGVGFDPTILDQAVRRGHLGVKQMRERVEDLKGTFSLQSQAGEGTEIQVVLPLSRSRGG